MELPELVKMLRRMQSLVSLTLHRERRESDDAPFKGKPVQLPHLRHFHCEGSTATQALRYWSSIIPSPSSEATLLEDIYDPDHKLWKKILESKAVTSSRRVFPDTLLLRHAYDDPYNISFEHAEFTSLPYEFTFTSEWAYSALSSSSPPSGITLRVEVEYEDKGRPHGRDILVSLQPLVAQHIRRLCIVQPDVALGIDDHTRYREDREMLRSTFRPWSQLRALCIVKPGSGTLRALRIRDEDEKDDTLLPLLRELEIEVRGHEPDGWWFELHYMLMSRRDARCALERFTLHGLDCPTKNAPYMSSKKSTMVELTSDCHSAMFPPCTKIFVDERVTF
ncbi:unnamed protein product [Peniophora sp. CBMAI 1063]|nr:unnamed protein product [Peniophora sp. CBMAI 1063]